MSKKLKIPKANKTYGYVGVWECYNQVGWFAPMHLTASKRYPDEPRAVNKDDVNHKYLKGNRLFLCEITAKPIVDKLGRPITKIVH